MMRTRQLHLPLVWIFLCSFFGLQGQINTFPYVEDFEAGPGGWTSAGIAPSGIQKNSWVRAAPINPLINTAASGSFCWITGNSSLTAFKYQSSEFSAVFSPYFDFSSLNNPYISLNIFWETEFSLDGAVLQATTDSGATWIRVGKAGDPVNWYNDNSVNGVFGGPGGQLHGWSGNFTAIPGQFPSNGSQGWVNAQHSLSFLAGQPSVRFRMAFASDGSAEDDGVAFDDILIVDLPVLDLGPDTTLCFLDTLVLSACIPTAFDYQWSTSSIDTFCTKIAVKTDEYIVRVEDTLGFVLRDTIIVFVSPTNAALGPDQLICPGDTITLNPVVPGPFRTWLPDSSTGTSLKVWETGTYKFITSDTYGCLETDSVKVQVDFVPIVDLGNDTLICAGSTVILDAGAGNPGTQYQWNIPGASTQTFFISAPGQYYVDVVTAAGCLESDTINVDLSLAPVVNLGPDFTACQPFKLDANNPGSTYLWSNGETTQSITTFIPGTYWVRVENQFGCISSDTISVVIGAIPVVDLGPDLVVCNGSSVTLNLGNPGATYFWSTGATTQSITVTDGGTYIGKVTNSIGCSRNDTINVIESPLFVNLGPDFTICDGDSALLDAGATGSGYLWSTGATTSQIWVTTGGKYVVEVSDQTGTCSAKDSLVIGTKSPFVASITVPDSSIIFQPVTFTDNTIGAFTSWQWTFGDGGTSKLENPTHTYNAVGPFLVCLTLSDGVCSNKVCDSIFVEIFANIEEELLRAFTLSPNPSTDQVNIAFEGESALPTHLSVLDVSGRLVYVQDLGRVSAAEVQIGVSTWAKGLYFVKLDLGERSVYRKLFVQ